MKEIFHDFDRKQIKTRETTINLVLGGHGYPVLMLHGYPQTHGDGRFQLVLFDPT
jgi:hypothetical protein